MTNDQELRQRAANIADNLIADQFPVQHGFVNFAINGRAATIPEFREYVCHRLFIRERIRARIQEIAR